MDEPDDFLPLNATTTTSALNSFFDDEDDEDDAYAQQPNETPDDTPQVPNSRTDDVSLIGSLNKPNHMLTYSLVESLISSHIIYLIQ